MRSVNRPLTIVAAAATVAVATAPFGAAENTPPHQTQNRAKAGDASAGIMDQDLWNGVLDPAEASRHSLEPQRLSVVLSFCVAPLDWLPAYLGGRAVEDLTIYSKCGQETKLLDIDVLVGAINVNRTEVVILPNVGGCDHTYAYDMAHRHWNAAANTVVLYLKDNPKDHFNIKTFMFATWDSTPLDSMVQQAALSGFGCQLRVCYDDTVWYRTPTLLSWRLGNYKREGGTHKARSDNGATDKQDDTDVEFVGTHRNVGDFAHAMGITIAADVMRVCYRGNFAVSANTFTPAMVEVAKRLAEALSRGNNIAEGHYMERLWAAWIHTPPTSAQVDRITKMHEFQQLIARLTQGRVLREQPRSMLGKLGHYIPGDKRTTMCPPAHKRSSSSPPTSKTVR